MESHKFTNRLINEKSPYLLQHAHNPVDWYPWSEEAFEKAGKENKLIFLSIGYSTCHWCHVMEKESFEKEDVARVMNDLFVSIKVDREERPDIDSAYMTVSQMMTGSGGWPLNIIMTPDRMPVFALTYIPRESRRGMVGIMELTSQLRELWSQGKDEIVRRAQEVMDNLKRFSYGKKGKAVEQATLNTMLSQLRRSFDTENGGFGTAPKFPSPQNLMFLMRMYKKKGDPELLDMVRKTLVSMRMGGIYDHIGYGFHRYSTDAGWFLPHFEKMIYDQAFQMMAYTEAYQITGEKLFRDVVYEIADFVVREMKSPEGAFYSAIDADSENEEGKFYTWRGAEIHQALGQEDAEVFLSVFNSDMDGNYVEESTGRSTGKNILYRNETLESEAKRAGLNVEELSQLIGRSRESLHLLREKRVKPHLDDKVLTDMNGLMIAALSKAHRAFNEEKFLETAKNAAEFVLNTLYNNGKLLHRYRDGESAINGYLDDYAFLTFGMIELFLSTMDSRYLKTARELSGTLENLFLDRENGGFFGSPSDGENLPVKIKAAHDGAIPSGNSVQMVNLLRLGLILSDSRLRDTAISVADAFASDIEKGAMYHCYMGIGINYALSPSYLVKLWKESPLFDEAMKMMNSSFKPDSEMLLLDEKNKELLTEIDEPMFAGAEESHSKIFVCTEKDCLPPVGSVDELKRITGQHTAGNEQKNRE